MLVRIDNVALGDVWSRLAQTERSDGPNTACNISLDLKLKHLSDDVIRLLKVTKAFSTTAEKGDQPELLHTVNLAVTLHSGTAAPLDIIYICVVRPMMPWNALWGWRFLLRLYNNVVGRLSWGRLSGSKVVHAAHACSLCSICMKAWRIYVIHREVWGCCSGCAIVLRSDEMALFE